MIMKKFLLFCPEICALTFWMVLIGFSSCHKDLAEDFTEEETIIENAAIGQAEADDVLDIAYQAEMIQKAATGGRRAETSCGLIYDDPINKILTIDFGTGCTGLFARQRSGKIIVTYASALGDTLANRSIRFDTFVVNQKKVEGTIELHDISLTTDGLLEATLTLTDFRISFPNSTAIIFNGSHTRLWTSGMGDTIHDNNVYLFTGSLNGVSSSGRSFTQDITTPVVASFYCASQPSQGNFSRVAGVVELTRLEGFPDRTRTVDYGDGTCNNKVTVATFRRTYGVKVN